MTISTRARLSLFLAIAALLVAGIVGAQSVGASGGVPVGAEPGEDGGGGSVSGICAAPGAEAVEDCDDTIGIPVEPDQPVDCGETVEGTGPNAVVSYTPCPGDEEPVPSDPYAGARKVEPTPGMANLHPIGFDKVVVGDDDRTLTIFFWSGVEPCYVLDHVDVAETPDTITITLFQGNDPSAGDVACIEIAELKKVVVQLDAPVAGRAIEDGAA